MKAISLWQPWASLVIRGSKTIETRSWSTHIRGPVLIHAGKTMDDHAKAHFGSPPGLPLGALLGMVEIINVKKYTRVEWEWDRRKHLCFFEWTDPLYGWELGTVRLIFSQPIPERGQQGFWNVPITAELIAAAGLQPEYLKMIKGIEEQWNSARSG